MARKPGIPKLKKEKENSNMKPVKEKRASIFGGRKKGSDVFLADDTDISKIGQDQNNNSYFAEDLDGSVKKTSAPKTKVPASKRNNSFIAEGSGQSAKVAKSKHKNNFFAENTQLAADVQSSDHEAEARSKKQIREEKRQARIDEKEAAYLAEEEAFLAEEAAYLAEEEERAKEQAEQEKAAALVQDDIATEKKSKKQIREEKRQARIDEKEAAFLAEEEAFLAEEAAYLAEEEERTKERAEQEKAGALVQDDVVTETKSKKQIRDEKRQARIEAENAAFLAEEAAFLAEEEERTKERAEQERAGALVQDSVVTETKSKKQIRDEKRQARIEAENAAFLAEEAAFLAEEEERTKERAEQEKAGALVQDSVVTEAKSKKQIREEKRQARIDEKEAAYLAEEEEPEDEPRQAEEVKEKRRGFFFGKVGNKAGAADATSRQKGAKADKSNSFLDETEIGVEKPESGLDKQVETAVQPSDTKQVKNKKTITPSERSKKKSDFATSTMNEKDAFEKKQSKGAKRIRRQGNNVFVSTIAKIKSLLPGGKDANEALAFVQDGKKTGKKGSRARKIGIYATAGALVIAILMVVVFVPFGEAADKTPESEDAAIAAVDSLTTSAPSAEAVATPSPEPTPSPTMIATTAPDQTHRTFNVDTMVEDCMVDAKLYYNEVGYSTNYYKYTENDIYMLAQLIYGEARGESLDGMVAVGNVVMNRVLNRSYFGNNIKAVITARSQFSGYNPNTVPNSKCKIAARKVLDFQVWVVPQNVYYFKSSGTHGIDWGSHKFYVQIGGHSFYTHRYVGRSNSDRIPPRLYERTYKWPRFGCYPEDRVYRVQFMLNQLGYDVVADQYYGIGTKDELKKFQEKKGLDADGVAGPATIEALIRAYGIEDYYDKFY